MYTYQTLGEGLLGRLGLDLGGSGVLHLAHAIQEGFQYSLPTVNHHHLGRRGGLRPPKAATLRGSRRRRQASAGSKVADRTATEQPRANIWPTNIWSTLAENTQIDLPLGLNGTANLLLALSLYKGVPEAQ